MRIGFFLREALRAMRRNAAPTFAELATVLVTMLGGTVRVFCLPSFDESIDTEGPSSPIWTVLVPGPTVGSCSEQATAHVTRRSTSHASRMSP